MFYNYLILILTTFFSITANGSRIGDGGAFGKRQPNICTNAQ
jgi:hypothetical protein